MPTDYQTPLYLRMLNVSILFCPIYQSPKLFKNLILVTTSKRIKYVTLTCMTDGNTDLSQWSSNVGSSVFL